MPEIIFDSSVLSNFAVVREMDILRRLYKNHGVLADHIRMEILRGIRAGHERLSAVLEAVSDGWLRETSLQTKVEWADFEQLSLSLGLGEASCIAIAKFRRLVFACDDLAARREAENRGIRLTGTLGILKKAVSRNLLDFHVADRILKNLIESGFYSPIRSLREIL